MTISKYEGSDLSPEAQAQIYQYKQDWLDAVMASDLAPTAKLVAYAIYKRMYGLKMESFPSNEQISADSNVSASNVSKPRKALLEGGWLDAELHTPRGGGHPYYSYALPSRIPYESISALDESSRNSYESISALDESSRPNQSVILQTNTTTNPSSKNTSKTEKDSLRTKSEVFDRSEAKVSEAKRSVEAPLPTSQDNEPATRNIYESTSTNDELPTYSGNDCEECLSPVEECECWPTPAAPVEKKCTHPRDYVCTALGCRCECSKCQIEW